MIIAVIPARGGSKRLPRKNIRSFCGRPVIAYSIDAARESRLFDRIIVSTDDDEVAAVATELGAEVPFRRPAELADDFTPTIPVIRHAVQQLSTPQTKVTHACCIYATAPFVASASLQQAFALLQDDAQLDFAFPITTFPFPIFRSLKQTNHRVEMFFPQHEKTRSQDLPEAWHDVGQFYWGTAQAWQTCDGIFSARTAGIPIPRYRVQDIDTEEDWRRAELMYQMLASQ